MGVPPESPTAVWGFGEQHPRTLLQFRTAGCVGDDVGELLHHSQLLSAVESSQVREHLDAYVVALALDVGDGPVRECVHERGRVVAKHGHRGNLLDAHQRRGQPLRERARTGERAVGRVDVNHRHQASPPTRSKPPSSHANAASPYASALSSQAKWPASNTVSSQRGRRSFRYSALLSGTIGSWSLLMIFTGVWIWGSRP